MKILLDESIDVEFRTRITGHDVFTVAYMGWKGLSNGALLARAAADGFDAMITTDKPMKRAAELLKNSLEAAKLACRWECDSPRTCRRAP